MPVKVLFVSHRFIHMGNHSGYDQLGEYLINSKEIYFIKHQNRKLNFLQEKIVNSLLSSYNRNKYGLYHNYNHFKTEYEAVRKSNSSGVDILHLAYLEDSLGYISDKRNKIKAKIVATSHQPPSWWKETKKNTDMLKCLDAMVVLSSEAKDYFEKFIPGRVFFIPHGIDTVFFSPQKLERSTEIKKKILFVGNWLRDFDSYVRTVHILNKMQIDTIEFHTVFPRELVPDHQLSSLLKYPNINWHKNIDDQSFLSLYRNSDALLLPLLGSTANNALLEAASCEIPIVTNICGGVKDYLNDQWEYLTDNSSPEKFVSKINFIFDYSNREKIKLNAEAQRDQIVKKFSWHIIASQMTELYQSI